MRGRKRSASNNRHIVEARRERQREAAERRRAELSRQAALRAALAKPRPGPRQLVERLLARGATPKRRLAELVCAVADTAPRLLSSDSLVALERMAAMPWLRPPSQWQRVGRGTERLFRSLAEHLFARYPMPAFLWSAFRVGGGYEALMAVAVHVASGGSLFEAVKTGLMPVPLTRKMCHEVMAHGGDASLLAAVRRAQVRAVGGNGRLLRAWLATDPGALLGDRERETFWHGVLAWFAANPMLPDSEVGPLADYIAHRRRQDQAFAMQGRSVLAMLRGMREWHGALGRTHDARQRVFEPSGFEALDVDRSRNKADGTRVIEVWHFREVLDSRTLADEGRAMRHCVYSYSSSIERRECSIWTLTLEDNTGHWRRLTIEVRDRLRLIVQARGRFNALPEGRDLVPLNAWASRNRLELGIGRR